MSPRLIVRAAAVPPRAASFASKGGSPPGFEKGLGVEVPEDFDQRRHEASPAGLMTGADAGAVVAMEVLVEQQIITPEGIGLELFGSADPRSPAGFVA